EAGGTMTAVVVGPGAEAVAAEAKRILPDADIFVQAERRGTAHAVLAAKAAIARAPDDVLVIFGDTPLIRPQTLTRIREALADGAARSEEHTSELQSRGHLVCRLLLEKKKKIKKTNTIQ